MVYSPTIGDYESSGGEQTIMADNMPGDFY